MSNRHVMDRDFDHAGFRALSLPTPVLPAEPMRVHDTAVARGLLFAEGTDTLPLRVGIPGTDFSASIVCDGLAVGTKQLASEPVTGLRDDARAWVRSVGDFFRYDPVSTLTADGITCIVAMGGVGRWLRMFVPNLNWHVVGAFYYDPSNVSAVASDENTGTSIGAPLRTYHEWTRRMWCSRISSARVLRLMSDETDITAGNFDFGTTITDGGYIELRGETTVIRSGTLTSGTVPASGNTADIIEDTTLVASWSDANGSGQNLVSSTANGAHIIRSTSGGIHAFITRDKGSKKARVSIPSTTSEDTTTAFSGTQSAFTSGTAYEVLSALPKFPGVRSNHNVPNAIRCIFIDFGVGSTTVRLQGSSIQFQLCSIRNFASINPTLGFNFYQCVFLSSLGGVFGGSAGAVPRFCTFVGNGTSTSWQLTNVVANWNTVINTWDGASFDINHAARLEIGGHMYFYDLGASQRMVSISNRSHFCWDTIAGSGNACEIMRIAGQMTKAGGDPATITVATSHTAPYVVDGTSYAAAEFAAAAPIKIAADAGFYR